MKKKLLSLVLAGAMVASTSVSAFASSTNVVGGSDEATPTTNVEITGQVLNSLGEAPAGTFKVTVPTAASFTVNPDGKLVAPSNITIQNGGEQSVDIHAESFTDTNQSGGITVVEDNEELKNKNKTNVSLSIGGNGGVVFLGSDKGTNKKGLYSEPDFSEQEGDFLLSTIPAHGEDNLILTGKAGSNTSLPDEVRDKGVSDRFTLVLKIKKTPKA